MGIGLTEEEYVAETAWDYQEGRISKLEAELAELREAAQAVVDSMEPLTDGASVIRRRDALAALAKLLEGE